MSLMLVTFVDMLSKVNTETSLLLFVPIMMGVIAYHIGSRNSTANGLTMAGIVVIGTGLLFFTFDSTAMTLVMTLGGVLVILGLSSIYFLNKMRK